MLRICYKFLLLNQHNGDDAPQNYFYKSCTLSNPNILIYSVTLQQRLQHFARVSATWRTQTRTRWLRKSIRRSAEVSPVSSSSSSYVRGFNRQISPLTQTHKSKSHGVRSDFALVILLVLHAQSTACKPAALQHTKRGGAASCMKGRSS